MAAPPISLKFLPRPLRRALLDFQKEGVRFGIRKQGRCLIGDEMGLGKTLQAISIAYCYKDAWPLLIVAPSSVKFSWIDEIEKWLPEVEPHDLNLIRSGCDISNLGKAMIHVVSYGLLSLATSKLLLEALECHKFNLVIIDESHYLKNRRSARTKHLLKICKKAKHAILLSGTPSLARPRELFPQLDIVCPGKFGSFSRFVERYCDAHSVFFRGRRNYDTSGASNLDELYYLLKTHVMIRRHKKEVLTQLPPKRRQKVVFDISESSSKYNKELQELMKEFKKCSAILKGSTDDQTIKSPWQEMNRLSTLVYHYTGLVKVGPVLKYIEDLAQGMEGKFIVFFRHRLVRQAIEAKLVAMKLKYICIAGDVPPGIRGELVHSFQTDPQVRIAALSIEAASFGITLTAAHHVVFAELHHTPGVIVQAEDRAHRIGQKLPVNVHYLIAKGTVDEILWSLIRRKVYVTTSTLDGKCKDLDTEDADVDQGRKLSACAAWIQDQEEDADDLEDFVMEQLSSKTVKKDQGQRDLRSFFAVTPVSSKSNSLTNDAVYQHKNDTTTDTVKQGVALKDAESPISDIEEEDFSTWDDLDDDVMISKVCDSVEISEENSLIKGSKPCIENLESIEPKPSEEALKEEECPLKPKKLKFKKVKNGKLSFTGSKTYTKLRQKEKSSVSPLKFVGSDPETESQTLRGYLDDKDEPEILNTEDHCSDKDGCAGEISRPNDRDFQAALQEADIECVAVVCKRTPSMLQNKRHIFDANSSEGMKLETGALITDSVHACITSQDSKGDSASKDIEGDISKSPEKTLGSVSPKTERLSDEIGKFQSCIEDSYEKSYSRHFRSETVNETDANSVDEGTKFHSSCSQERQSVENISSQIKFVPVDSDMVVGEEELCEGKKRTGDGTEVYLSNSEALGGNAGSTCSSVVDSFMCSLQNGVRKERSFTNIIVEDTEKTGVTANCPDGDSSDDFQVSGIKNSRRVHTPVTQKPSKGKKRKASNKVKEKTVSRGACDSSKLPPADWSCAACTFINDGQLLECSICFTPRGKTDEIAYIAGNDDLGRELFNEQVRGDVEMVDNTDPSDVRGDSKDINSIGANCSMIGAVEKGDGSSQRSVSSSQLTPLLKNQQTVELHAAENALAYNLSSESVDGERPSVDDSGNNQSAGPGFPPWACSVCTFLNLSEMIECSICLTPRRRSQRLSTSKKAVTLETQREVGVGKTSLNKRRRWKGDRKEKGEKSGEKDLEAGKETFGVIPLEESNDNTTAHFVRDVPMAKDDGRTPEPVGPSHDTGSSSNTQDGHEVSSEESSGEIPFKPRKRLRLEEVEADIVIRTNRTVKCSTAISSSTGRKEVVAGTPFDGEDVHVAVSVDRAVSAGKDETNHKPKICETDNTDCEVKSKNELDVSNHLTEAIHNSEVSSTITSEVSIGNNFPSFQQCDKMEHRTNQKRKNCEISNSDCEMKCKDVSDHSVEAIHSGEVSSTVSSQVTIGNNLLTLQKSGIDEVGENLEELKAAAEELFNLEWEDDDCWWEEESYSGQSSLPSSGETTSGSPTVTSPGFTKCSDLYSVIELKNKLQATPKRSNSPTTTVQQVKHMTGNPENKLASSLANEYTFRPESDPLVEEEEEEEDDESEAVAEVMKLKFCLSLHTERVYLYNKEDIPLGINFCTSDARNRNIDDLPVILHLEENLKQVKRFLDVWKRMGEGKKRILRKSGLVFDDPLEAYECARKGMTRASSYVRYPSKETRIQNVIDTAEEIGGKVRVVKKPKIVENRRNRKTDRAKKTDSTVVAGSVQSTSTTQESTSSKAPEDKTCYQAVTADGTPLCLFCKGPVEFVDKVQCSDWDARFCSFDCKQEYQVRVSGTAARRALFEAERGICQLCSMDAHSFYQNVAALHVRDRPAFLAQTPYSSLPQQMLKKIIMDPKEGMFWEADHITPVSEGGGKCGLDNLRTLCVMCHRKATGDLKIRLKQRKVLKHAAGYADISTFFRPLT